MSRFLNTLQQLLRLRQNDLDELQQRIALLDEQIELRQLVIEKNTSYINTERLIASVNITGSDTLEAFVEQKKLQNQQYQQENQELKLLMEEARDQLHDAFIEQKKIEKIKNSEEIRIAKEENRQEMQVIDEIAKQMNIKKLTKY